MFLEKRIIDHSTTRSTLQFNPDLISDNVPKPLTSLPPDDVLDADFKDKTTATTAAATDYSLETALSSFPPVPKLAEETVASLPYSNNPTDTCILHGDRLAAIDAHLLRQQDVLGARIRERIETFASDIKTPTLRTAILDEVKVNDSL